MVTKFLEKILGPDYKALMPLLKTNLEGVIVARSTVSWLRESPLGDLNCGVLLLSKSETGITGVIEFDGSDYLFTDATPEHAAAAITLSLGVTLEKDVIKDLNLAKLGKTIDLMIKSINKKKGVDEPEVGKFAQPIKPKLPEPALRQIPQIKTRGRITSIPNTQPQQLKPDPRAIQPPLLPIKPGLPKIKLSEKEMGRKCDVCGRAQVSDKKFVGCSCLKGISKSVKSQLVAGGLLLELGTDWDNEAALTLLEMVGRY
jgi:hypothetical protein